MPGAIAEAFVELRADLTKFEQDVKGGMDDAERTVKKQSKDIFDPLEKSGGAASSGLNSAFGGIGKTLALVGGAAGVGAFAKGAFDAAEESNKISAQTQAVIKSTGQAAGITADQVGDLATALSKKNGVDDEAIQSGANLLLTFTNIKNEAGDGNDIFNQATQTMTDMAAAMGTDVSSGAIQLGKALNDPVEGISALSRVGVTFTDEQKNMIKTMVETGDTAGAQGVILGELNKEFGGSAAAQATASDRMGIAMGNLQESIGNLIVPIMDKLMPAFQSITDWLSNHQGVMVAVAAIVGVGLVGAFTAWAASAIAAAAATVLAAAPVIAIGVAIAALVAGVIYAYQNFEWFRNTVDAVASFLQDTVLPIFQAVFGWLVENVPAIITTIGDTIMAGVEFIQGIWDEFGSYLIDYITAVWNMISGIVQGAVDVVMGIFNLFKDLFTGNWSKLWDDIKQIFTGVWDMLVSYITGIFDTMKALFGAVWTAIGDVLGAAWDGFKTLISKALDVIVGFIEKLPGRAAGALSDLASAIGGMVTDAFNGAKKIVTDGIAEIVKFVSELPGKLLEFVGKMLDAGASLGSSIIDGISNGIKNAASTFADVATAILDAFKKGWNAVADKINSFIPNDVGFSTPFGFVGVDLPDNPVPRFAKGGILDGMGLVGERGPELISVGSPSRITSNSDTAQLLGGGGWPENLELSITGPITLMIEGRPFTAMLTENNAKIRTTLSTGRRA